ncbi:uncharacterized protein LOC142173402 [Nicotiana tabacum]|uniref:Uncharacterized protein LOC142173402 n=1 Tax=Nicotiana tabacum TaxID=4097 RepID=A0AC58TCY5_TOBAC
MGLPWLFVAWGMDVIGFVEPATSNRHRFILVAIDYFTKWVEASTYKAVTKKVVADFVQNNIVCRFGIPKSIITENVANLNNDLMREICEKFRIVHRNSTAYRTNKWGSRSHQQEYQENSTNDSGQSHAMARETTFALLGYRNTMRTSTRAMPYMLVYSNKVVIPMEVKISSLRVIQEAKLDDTEWIRVRQEQLMLIDEKRIDVVCHGQLYQNRMDSVFKIRVKPRQFTPGQLVL